MNSPVFTKRPLLAFLLHWLAWVVIYFLTYLPTLLTSTKIVWGFVAYNYLVIASVNFLMFYLVAFYLLPRIGIKEKKWVLLAIICLLLVCVFTLLKYELERFRLAWIATNTKNINTAKWAIVPRLSGLNSPAFRFYVERTLYNTISFILMAFAYRFLLAWLMQEKAKKELENQKLHAELSFLKMQVNPHFLFNALNNIYSLAVMEQSPKTGNSIMKLSELVRYVLYEKEDDELKVSLDKEIKHINSFIDLEKLRHFNDVYINFSIEGDTTGKRIVPLLLFPLIENACKHGILNDVNKPVDITMKVSDSLLEFTCENYSNDYQKDKNGGIGLVNVQKRLELLYGNMYPILISNNGNKFVASLRLPL